MASVVFRIFCCARSSSPAFDEPTNERTPLISGPHDVIPVEEEEPVHVDPNALRERVVGAVNSYSQKMVDVRSSDPFARNPRNSFDFTPETSVGRVSNTDEPHNAEVSESNGAFLQASGEQYEPLRGRQHRSHGRFRVNFVEASGDGSEGKYENGVPQGVNPPTGPPNSELQVDGTQTSGLTKEAFKIHNTSQLTRSWEE